MSVYLQQLRNDYDVIARKGPNGLIVETTKVELPNGNSFLNERDLYDTLNNINPDLKYIILEAVNG